MNVLSAYTAWTRRVLVLGLLLCLALNSLTILPILAAGAESPTTPVQSTVLEESPHSQTIGAEHQEHGLPQSALEIARPFGLPVTNSMLVTWLVAGGLIIFAQVATRRME